MSKEKLFEGLEYFWKTDKTTVFLTHWYTLMKMSKEKYVFDGLIVKQDFTWDINGIILVLLHEEEKTMKLMIYGIDFFFNVCRTDLSEHGYMQ